MQPDHRLNVVVAAPKPGNRWQLGVRGKVIAILFGTLFVILTANSLFAQRALEQEVLDEADRRGHAATHFIAQSLASSLASYDYNSLALALQELTRRRDVLYANVENTRGDVMAHVGADPGVDADARRYQSEIRLNGERLGQLRLVYSLDGTHSTLAERRRELWLGLLFSLGLFMLAGYLTLSVLVVRPLARFSRTTHRNLQGGGAALEPVAVDSRDEFGDLARGFNNLQGALESARQELETRIEIANRELQAAYQRLEEQAEALRESNRDLEQLSITDPLTGLYNRRYFEKLMENELAQSIRNDDTLSILLLDIDHLNDINDRHGQGVGDRVLRHIAQVISSRVRLTDTACRFSGDQFFILGRRATIANAVAMADDILHAVQEHPILDGNNSLHVSLSIGVATIPGVTPVATAEALFKQAEAALRFCKQHGRNGVTHYSMLERVSRSAQAG